MKSNLSELFSNNAPNQFNKIALDDDKSVLKIKTIGLHSFKSIGMPKEHHLHSHSFSELHFSLNGCAVYQFADEHQIKLNAGNWVLIPANVPHIISDYSGKYVKFSCSFELDTSLCVDMDAEPVYNVINELLKKNEIYIGKTAEIPLVWIETIYKKMFDKHSFTPIILRMLSETIVMDTLSSLCQTERKKTVPMEDVRFETAVQFIKDNIFNKIDSSDVSRKTYLSQRQLDRIFQKKLSVSVTEFMLEQKCETAKQLLASTTLPLKDISEKLKFSTPSYFSFFFKKRVGISPQAFRDNNKSLDPNK